MEEAISCIPLTNPFLKQLMRDCLGAEATSYMAFDELDIGNVVDLLAHTNTKAIIRDFNRQTGGGREDPVIHFYEEFLTAYDKAQKVQRGVFYTPQPVVNFIVRAVDDILKTEFGFQDGLATTETKKIKIQRLSERKIKNGLKTIVTVDEEVPAVQILDPATGTGTFIRQVILRIYENFCAKNAGKSKEAIKQLWNDYVPKHLLPRINAFELMMAPYAVAHMKLAMVLLDTGYEFASEERLNVCLTNTLEPPGDADDQVSMFQDPLAMESIQSNRVKRNKGISIIIGNPPYSGESANKGDFINSLMEEYKKEPGGQVKLQERNPKWINDDYVKFIRYAEDRIFTVGKGILAYVNPHGFIANPTFRGMRWHLMQTFDFIYVIDLHGNSNRQECSPDGSKDENVFDIQQGVCILICVKTGRTRSASCRVYHADVFGLREKKYDYLNHYSLNSISFCDVKPDAPEYIFHPVNSDLKNIYNKGFNINELLPINSVGIVTARDSLTMDFTPKKLHEKTEKFRKMPIEEARSSFNLGNDVRDWRIEWAQNDIERNLVQDGILSDEKMTQIMYRVFDKRYIYYTGTSRGLTCYPRVEVMSNMLWGENIALATARSNKSDSCSHFFVTDIIMEAKCAERTTQSSLFPLYLYRPIAGKMERSVNLSDKIVHAFAQGLGIEYNEFDESNGKTTFSAKHLFYYIYAVLYSMKYREKYDEFLKSDYPRIPYIVNTDAFWKLVNLGNQLCDIHLMKDSAFTILSSEFVDAGNNIVDKPKWKDEKIYINKQSYYADVSENIWEFMIGGYQPLLRWFKERKDTFLSQADILHYRKMIQAIKNTIDIMQQIDSIIEL